MPGEVFAPEETEEFLDELCDFTEDEELSAAWTKMFSSGWFTEVENV